MTKENIFERMKDQSGDLSSLVMGTNSGAARSNAPPKGPTSHEQLIHRMQFCNAMTGASLLAYSIRGAFPKKAKHQTDANAYVHHNLGAGCKEKVYLNQAEMNAGACVILKHLICDGPLESIEVVVQGDHIKTSLRVPQGFAITASTTLGAVATALTTANAAFLKHDQLSIVHPIQGMVLQGGITVPRVKIKLYEFTLDPDSTVPFYSLVPAHLFLIKDRYIVTGANIEPGAVTYVPSRKKNGKLLMSKQIFEITPNNTTYKTYTSEVKKLEALGSFNAIEPFFYDPAGSGHRQDHLSPVEPPTPVDPGDPGDPDPVDPEEDPTA